MILAPMQGLTEVLFRRVYEECFPHAIEKSVAPFISLTKGNLGEACKKIGDVLPEANKHSIPVIPQILGKEPTEFVDMANRLYDLGYDEVNWNIGCPMRAITGKHRGSGILPYPDEVRGVLEAVMPNIKPKLSVKMRLGLKSKEEIYHIIPVLNSFELASVTIHPRTGQQQYNGVPDRDAFGKVLPMIHAPVVYNGDINTVVDAAAIRNRFPQISDIMIGRGILYNPTLPLEIMGAIGSEAERDELNRRFIVRLVDEIGRVIPTEQSRIRKTKEYWCLLWKALPISENSAREVLREEDYATIIKMIYQHVQ